MYRKLIFTSLALMTLASCAQTESTKQGWPWWIWLLIILVLVISIYFLIRAMGRKEQEATQQIEKVEPIPTPQPEAPDDLTMIEGIGPKIQSVLQAAGIKKFTEVADMAPEAIKQLLTDAGLRLGVTDTWPQQAKLAAEGKFEELKELQDKLSGGREA